MKFGNVESIPEKKDKNIQMSKEDHIMVNLPIGWFNSKMDADSEVWDKVKEKFDDYDKSWKSMSISFVYKNMDETNYFLYLIAKGFYKRGKSIFCIPFNELDRFVNSHVDFNDDYTNYDFLKSRTLLIISEIESPNEVNLKDWSLMLSLSSSRHYWRESTVLAFCDEKDFFTKTGRAGLILSRFEKMN